MTTTTRVSMTSTGGQADGGSYLDSYANYNYGGPGTAVAQVFNPNGSEIVFTSNAENLVGSGNSGVVIKNLQTGVATASYVVAGTSSVSSAQFTPDGTSIVFQTNTTVNGISQQDIVEKNLSTGAVSTIAPNSSSSGVSLLATSSNGGRVAFTESAYSGSTYVRQAYVEDLSTGKTLKVGPSSSRGQPGSTLMFDKNVTTAVYSVAPTGSSGTTQIYSENLTTGKSNIVSSTQSGVVGNQASFGAFLSQDATETVFTSTSTNLAASATQGGVFVKTLANGALGVVAANSGSGNTYIFNSSSALSSDGKEVAFVKDTYTGGVRQKTNSFQLQVANLSTKVTKTIPGTLSETQTNSGTSSSEDGSYFEQVVFSADGSKVAYVTQTIHSTGSSNNLSEALTVYDLSANVTTTVGSTSSNNFIHNIQFSPDGTQLQFSTSGSSGSNVTVYNLTTNTSATVPTDDGSVFFSPDSKSYAYSTSDPSQVSGDTNNASDVFITSVCFASGTSIRTTCGDVPVENLSVGDLVVTASGAMRPIRWLGHRRLDCRKHPRPAVALPIEIAADAFGAGLPARALRVSPGHAICVDVLGEALVPAGVLVNGSTVRQVDVDEVTYWHVELDSHDIVLAENLPCESYLEMANRGFFSESDVVDLAAGPDADTAQKTHAAFCRPFHGEGHLVDAVRARLCARATELGRTIGREPGDVAATLSAA